MLRLKIFDIFRDNKNRHNIQFPLENKSQDADFSFEDDQGYNDLLSKIFREEANYLVECLKPDNDIGRNSALLENVFSIFVSIYNTIPLFLTGPPGCSKTLSYFLISKSLMGTIHDKKHPFL